MSEQNINRRFPRFPWRLAWRLPLFLLHIAILLPLALLTFLPGLRSLSFGGMRLYQHADKGWNRMLLRIFGIRLKVTGGLPDGPCLIVSNHISWMDINLLHALWPMWLVAKAEIRDWPLVGPIAVLAGTIFIKRGSEPSRHRVTRRMAALLKRGERVGIFPEAGISTEAGVGRFHARLFAPAIRVDVPVVPVAIRYYRNGDLHDVMVFAPGENFFMNLLRLLAQPPSEGQVMIGAPLHGTVGERSTLARRSNEMVKSFYES